MSFLQLHDFRDFRDMIRGFSVFLHFSRSLGLHYVPMCPFILNGIVVSLLYARAILYRV